MTREQRLKLAVGQARQLVDYLERAWAYEKVNDQEQSAAWENRARTLATKLGHQASIASTSL